MRWRGVWLPVLGTVGSWRRRWAQRVCVTLAAFLLAHGLASAATPVTQPCRVSGIATAVQCGSVRTPLDPARPEGPQIEIHYLVVPAMARNKQPDAVLVLAGGPGQSAMTIAPALLGRLGRLNNRRDLVFVDQRGTGKSAPLFCPDESDLPLQQAMDPAQQLARVRDCKATLERLPYGDLRFFSTSHAVPDFEAVRAQLGVTQWNQVGASYGTRVALEYLSRFPGSIRRSVLDGVAPSDMELPASSSVDGQAALEQVWSHCDAQLPGGADCARHFPRLQEQWRDLLDSLPRSVSVAHPVTGMRETFVLTREALLRVVRSVLYVPALTAGLPAAVQAATAGDFGAIIGLSSAMGNKKTLRMAMGMHFSVVCAEDLPRLSASLQRFGSDFGRTDADMYNSICKFWPRAQVPPIFFSMAPAMSPVLLLSGGADPATPPRHGDKVTKALGDKAQHLVVPEAGHGVMALGCMRDVVFKFITAADDAKALPQEAACATAVPRPAVFIPVQARAQRRSPE